MRSVLLSILLALLASLAGAADLPPIRHVSVTAGDLAKAVAPGDATPGYWIVQLDPAAKATARTLQSAGIDVIGYVPDSAWLVHLTEASAKQVQRLPKALRMIAYRPDMKRRSGKVAASQRYFVLGRPSQGAAELAAELSMHAGVRVIHANALFGLTYASVAVPDTAAIDALTGSAAVVWIEPEEALALENSDSVGVIQANTSSGGLPPTNTPIWDRGLTGTGQVVAVADSGLDRNEDWFRAIDQGNGVVDAITDAEEPPLGVAGTVFPDRKVRAYWVQPGASAYDNSQVCRDGGSPTIYHGTHVSGTVAGDSGTVATPAAANHDLGDGMAPGAQLLFQDIGDDVSGCLAIEDFASMLLQAHLGGAHIHNNSWGAVPTDDDDNFEPGYYRNDFLGDLAMHGIHDLLVVTSNGNSGDNFDAPQRTTGPPANGKNILSVGATEHGNDPAIASFSSRGPAHDDRVKPDIVAPGVDILSARGDTNNGVPPPPFGGDQLVAFDGTSMASPTVAGGAALARQYFADGFYPTGSRSAADAMSPSGAFMKATLLNGTRLYADTPSITTGWGRMWLDDVLYFPGDQRRLRAWDLARTHGLATGDQHVFEVDVRPGSPFRATLAWFDPPALSGTERALVNDLDLEITGPDGQFLGNVMTGGQSSPGGNADRLNPVEQVILANPAGGVYTVRVVARNVPGNSIADSTTQAYGLVVTAGGCGTRPAVPDFDLASGETIAVTTDARAEIYRAEGSCAAPTSEFRFAGNSTGRFDDPRVQSGSEYAYRVRGVNSCDVSALSTCKSVVAGESVTALDVSGPWFNPAQAGHGWFIEQLEPTAPGGADRIIAYWYVYRDGNPVWLIAQGELSGATTVLDAFITRGAQFPPDFASDDVILDTWGTLQFDFTDDVSGVARWVPSVDGFSAGELAIQRLAPLSIEPAACVSGSYINTDQSGHGFVVETLEVEGRLEVLVAWYVYRNGEQVWLLGQAPLENNQAVVPLSQFSGANFPPAFDPATVASEAWGTLTLTFNPPELASASWETNAEGFSSGSLSLSRLTSIVGRSCP